MQTFCALAFFLCSVISVFGQQSSTNNDLNFQSEKYRVSVESIQREANNYSVTLIFENTSNKEIRLKWLQRGSLPKSDGPYLVDERGNKYFIETNDRRGVLSDVWYGGENILPNTKFKIKYTFFGSGNGTEFSLMATEVKDVNYYVPVVIKGIKLIPSITTNAVIEKASFITESYRSVVDSMSRDRDNIYMTMIFESLSDQVINLCWGRGYGDQGAWKTQDIYLIDENSDRYYLRQQDSGKIVDNSMLCHVEILPRTKLKTQFAFNADNLTGTKFTFAAKEGSPKSNRPVVIQNLSLDNGLVKAALPMTLLPAVVKAQLP